MTRAGFSGGLVSLVGAGPGDPELITIRGLRRLQEADDIVHDRLIPAALLDHRRTAAHLHDVGKTPGDHACSTQEEINALLIGLGKLGRRVVRLKGGDPFMFGRGGEEAIALRNAGVPFEIVPGVSSALAAPAAAGIPVTHRGLATSVTVATGHGASGTGDGDHDWEALARMRGTLVFMMPVGSLEQITSALIANGRAPDEPAALVRCGTMTNQQILASTLQSIAQAARTARVTSPAVLVVGETVRLSDHLASTDHVLAPVLAMVE
jgi:uroporphyrin-III C-methyltransferase